MHLSKVDERGIGAHAVDALVPGRIFSARPGSGGRFVVLSRNAFSTIMRVVGEPVPYAVLDAIREEDTVTIVTANPSGGIVPLSFKVGDEFDTSFSAFYEVL